MGKVVGVRFQRGSKVYDFDSGHFVLSSGDNVIVETEQGLALGQVVRTPQNAAEPRDEDAPPLKSVYRMATDEDLAQIEDNARLEEDAQALCLERIEARGLPMNLVKVECLFDRSKIVFYFTADGRLDFRELVRDLVSRLRTRVELRQIGVRHEAKLLGGLGSCGRELCCSTFLRDFEPVSVKMAKEQNLSLNPTKISGLCGRLMCCLTYEFATYKEHKKDMPNVGKRLKLGDGLEAKVIRQNVLQRQITIITNDGREITCSPQELNELSPLQPKEQKAQPSGAKPPERGRPKPRVQKRKKKGPLNP